jgi:hypothetical protein
MKTLLLPAILLITFAVSAQAPSSAPVAVKDEPHHHLLLENDYVHAYYFELPGHEATLLHTHALPYMGVALGPVDAINAVTGKPEAQVKLSDGQITYSKGGFDHLVRTDAGSSFHNFTVEFLKPQGAARNRCAKVVADSPLDCSPAAATPLDAATTAAFETDEVAVRSGEVASFLRIAGADTKPARLLLALEGAQIGVEVPGQPVKTLHTGEAAWLNAGSAATLVNAGEHSTSRFIVVTFKDSAEAK